ncbi:gamma-glutamyl-gamma-aminobutyrate hydrolase family protein [Crossiella cryophila]|uniref:Anthranilate synthase component 2/putative glutamine amidotransferase n=1 Tax=Crossiella cryophila TaxID=43355 RepID=A0A7W7CDM0_9PSEU|nr:gamma-glutamyl-gamma-aminobutyrate hydrolase family protein [Crossiella cryophila]MBB4679240.1 anthranilate synthase component 2/putative glutamine amidotransferase [Crossiella cryophila]
MASNASDAPVIGISCYLETTAWGVWQRPAALLPASYLDAVATAGGIPVLLPPGGNAARVLPRLDGLILAGGADIDPRRYQAEPTEHSTGIRPDRDSSELALLYHALDRRTPLLAICRGAQLLNVGLGGTLHQHLPEVLGHRDHQPAPGRFGRTTVHLEPGCPPATLLGEKIEVSCYHHQAIDRLAPGLEAVGHAADGTIEAVRQPSHPFALGVQWHPEEDTTDPAHPSAPLFAALVSAARGATA